MKVQIGKLAATLAVGALFAVPAFAQSGSGVEVTVNRQPVNFAAQGPIESGGRVLVPLRGVLEKLGAYVNYDSARQEVRAVRNETQIVLPIGSTNARVGGRNVTLDAPARIVNGSTMVPLRFVAEALGARVNFEPSSNTVAIFTGGGMDVRPSDVRSPVASERPRPSSTADVVRGTIVAIHPDDGRLVIQSRDGDRHDLTLSHDVVIQRRTTDGFTPIDIDRLHVGDMVSVEVHNDHAHTVTLIPDRVSQF